MPIAMGHPFQREFTFQSTELHLHRCNGTLFFCMLVYERGMYVWYVCVCVSPINAVAYESNNWIRADMKGVFVTIGAEGAHISLV